MKQKILLFFISITFSIFAQANQALTTDESSKIPDLIGFFNSYTTLSDREDKVSTLNSQFSILNPKISLDSMPDSLYIACAD